MTSYRVEKEHDHAAFRAPRRWLHRFSSCRQSRQPPGRRSNGALVQIDSTRRTGYGYDERIDVLGSTGMIEARRQRSGSVSRYGTGRVVDDGLHPGRFERVQPTYAAALDHFVRCLDHDGAISPSLEDGLKAQAIAEAATRSLTTSRSEPITYPEFGSR